MFFVFLFSVVAVLILVELWNSDGSDTLDYPPKNAFMYDEWLSPTGARYKFNGKNWIRVPALTLSGAPPSSRTSQMLKSVMAQWFSAGPKIYANPTVGISRNLNKLSEFQTKFTESGDWDFALGSVFAIRGWTVNPVSPGFGMEGFYLSGQFNQPWDGPEFTATCGLKTCKRSPGDNCPCGIYAYWKIPQDPTTQIYGVVECFGRVVLGPNGVRAEKARIVALSADDNLSLALHERYPVKYYPTVFRMLEAHPLSKPPES